MDLGLLRRGPRREINYSGQLERVSATLTFPSEDFSVDFASISLFARLDTLAVASTASDSSLSVSIADESFSLLKRLRYGLAATSVIPLAEGKPRLGRRLPKNWLDCRGNAVATELGFAGGNGRGAGSRGITAGCLRVTPP